LAELATEFLPNGQHFFISVFVTDSKEDADAKEKKLRISGKLLGIISLQRQSNLMLDNFNSKNFLRRSLNLIIINSERLRIRL
jgi:hypothetical protein